VTHYEALGVARDATPTALREAFRRSARAAHPDRHGEASSAQMAAVNEAWHVLGDPDRRRRYDEQLAAGERTAGSPDADTNSSHESTRPITEPTATTYHQPARFPWRFMAVLASMGVLLIIVGLILYEPPTPITPDGLLVPGSCVDLTADGRAREVVCGQHSFQVRQIIEVTATCPVDTERYQAYQTGDTVCLVRTVP
jgi:hypothetical protein